MSVWSSFAKEAFEKTLTVAKFFCFLHVTNSYLCSSVLCVGPSMLPTINLTGDLLLCEKVSHRLGKVQPGDIVTVRSPDEPCKVVTKRLIGLEGHTVTYVVDPCNSDQTNTIVVPKGHIWVEGDNIYSSKDSRNYGAVPYGLLYGRIFCRLWPNFGPLGQRPKQAVKS